LFDGGNSPPSVAPDFDIAQLFRAYRRLRFEEQIGYAEHKLRTSNVSAKLIGAPLRNQREGLHAIWTVAFGALVALHGGIVIGTLACWCAVRNPWLPVVSIWLALFALGVRTLEEGLRLSQEIERYEDYRAEVSDAFTRFDHASTTEDKLRVMMDMEQIAFDEMRSFLRTASESSFVL
jgi:hypothetical protein